jgi:hypothetical protein
MGCEIEPLRLSKKKGTARMTGNASGHSLAVPLHVRSINLRSLYLLAIDSGGREDTQGNCQGLQAELDASQEGRQDEEGDDDNQHDDNGQDDSPPAF